ncbi:hypothetical protein D3C72_2306870 [compost metagenome]
MFAPVAFKPALIGDVVFSFDQLDANIQMVMRDNMRNFRRHSLNDGIEFQLSGQQTGNAEIMFE